MHRIHISWVLLCLCIGAAQSYAAGICKSEVSEHEGNFFELRDGAVLKKTGYGYVGYIGYAKKALLIKKWTPRATLVIEGQDPFEVEILKEPDYCSSPGNYEIEAAGNGEKFLINGEAYKAMTYCWGWDTGDSVIFMDDSEFGACVSAKLYNIDRNKACSVWCE